ncbi:unnamed protein product, partial [Didymodactylos carnosus]
MSHEQRRLDTYEEYAKQLFIEKLLPLLNSYNRVDVVFSSENDFSLHEIVHLAGGSTTGLYERRYLVGIVAHHPTFEKYSYYGEVYRGMKVTDEDLAEYEVGSRIMTKSFLSATKDYEIAKKFASGGEMRANQLGILVKFPAMCAYIIKNKRTGLAVEDLSEYKQEQEVMIIPFSVFRVKSVDKREDWLTTESGLQLGMMKLYDDDTELRELLSGFMGLALLPIDRVHEGYEILKQRVTTSSHTKQLDTFVSYFENEWLNVFKPSTWSVNKSTWRTNNHAEAQNRRFFTRVIQPHPNMWRFIQCVKQEESVVSHRMVQTGLGFSSVQPKKSTRKAARKTKQIENLLHSLTSKTRSLADTIKSLAHLVGEPVCRGRKGKKNKNNVSKS